MSICIGEAETGRRALVEGVSKRQDLAGEHRVRDYRCRCLRLICAWHGAVPGAIMPVDALPAVMRPGCASPKWFTRPSGRYRTRIGGGSRNYNMVSSHSSDGTVG